MPTIDILVAIAKVLNLDVEDITDFESEPLAT
jgi:DNA-binding XRE family transcriptional regulator